MGPIPQINCIVSCERAEITARGQPVNQRIAEFTGKMAVFAFLAFVSGSALKLTWALGARPLGSL